MNNTTDIAIYCDTIAKFPKEFIEKYPDKVLGAMIFVAALPVIKDIAHEIGDNFRYWVDAKYGATTNSVVDSVDATVHSDPTAA